MYDREHVIREITKLLHDCWDGKARIFYAVPEMKEHIFEIAKQVQFDLHFQRGKPKEGAKLEIIEVVNVRSKGFKR